MRPDEDFHGDSTAIGNTPLTHVDSHRVHAPDTLAQPHPQHCRVIVVGGKTPIPRRNPVRRRWHVSVAGHLALALSDPSIHGLIRRLPHASSRDLAELRLCLRFVDPDDNGREKNPALSAEGNDLLFPDRFRRFGQQLRFWTYPV